ncbi:tetratricopeptide (TPR) repeat protein [Micromonospora luteifusca]|uniref:Tetratricopeptide (TPR) repeat protein n=1 Tax=Micromonospora luteifusca TaxID=709860 RepID=A0ABS2M1Y2_9ACTN|nr:hypothetical protein [Micromonospora luteifusca]MBM7494197.1 tetratricopeptide (TPR) repeat protein [Micromonospora luteifusca]
MVTALDKAIATLDGFRAGGRRLASRSAALSHLLFGLWLRWQDGGDDGDLREITGLGPFEGPAAELVAAAEKQLAHDKTVHSEVRLDVALTLRNARGAAYKRTGDVSHLDEVIRLGLVAAEFATGDDRADLLSAQSAALIERYGRTGSVESRDEAITAVRRERLEYPVDHDNWLSASTDLHQLIAERWMSTRDPADGSELVALSGELVANERLSREKRAQLARDRSNLLWDRARNRGSAEDLGRAVESARDWVRLGDDDPGQLSSICYLLQSWFTVTEVPDDLREAVALGRRSVERPAMDPREQRRRLSNLFGAEMALAETTGERADHDAAVATARTAVEVYPPGDPARSPDLMNLALALWQRCRVSGDRGDLDESLRVGREAMRTAGEQDRIRVAATLLGALGLRLEIENDPAARDEGLRLLGRTPPADPALLNSIRIFAEAVRRHPVPAVVERFLHDYTAGLLEIAIQASEEGARQRKLAHLDLALALLATAEAVTPTPNAAVFEGLRGQMMLRHWQVSRRRVELDEAIGLLIRAGSEESDPRREMAGQHLWDAAVALYRRFRRRRRIADLHEARRQMERALAATAPEAEERPRMVQFLAGIDGHLTKPSMLIGHGDLGEADREDLSSPAGIANVMRWNQGERRESGLTWVDTGGPDVGDPGSPRVLFLRTFTEDDASYVVLNSLGAALDGGSGRIEIVSDQRDRATVEQHWAEAFGKRPAPIDFVAPGRDGWRRTVLERMAAADVIVLHVSPKDVDFPEFPFAQPSTELGMDWDRFMDAPMAGPITGGGLLREVSFLNRVRRLPVTVVVCDGRYRDTLDDLIALGGVMGDFTDMAGNWVTPRLAAIDKQVGHLRRAYRGISYRRADGEVVVSDLAGALGLALGDLRDADITLEPAPWRPADLCGRSPEPRRLPPDGAAKIVAYTDVEAVLFLPEGEITEIDHREVPAILSRAAIATGCPYCRAPIERMFFFVRELMTREQRASGTPDLHAKCQVCGRKSSQWDTNLMPQ